MTDHDLLQIPITDSDRRLVGLEILQPLASGKAQYENPVVLMAGGFGKRLHPITLKTPKPLLRLGSKPVSQLILEQLIYAGFRNFFLSVHYKADQVKRHFGDGKFVYSKQSYNNILNIYLSILIQNVMLLIPMNAVSTS